MNTKVAAICFSLACMVNIAVQASILTVTNTNDNGPGSLRQALVNANFGDTIDATHISGIAGEQKREDKRFWRWPAGYWR